MHTSIWYYQSPTVHNQFVLSLLAAKITLAGVPTICERITVRWQHNRTIGKLSVWNNRQIVRLSADTIVRRDYRPNPSFNMYLPGKPELAGFPRFSVCIWSNPVHICLQTIPPSPWMSPPWGHHSPRPNWRSLHTLAVPKDPTSKGKEGKGRGGERGVEEKVKRREGERWREGFGTPKNCRVMQPMPPPDLHHHRVLDPISINSGFNISKPP